MRLVVVMLTSALVLGGCRDRARRDDARAIAERLAGIQPGEEREISPGVHMKMHRIQATNPVEGGWHRAVSTEGAFSVELPLAFNDFRTRTETTDRVEIRSHSIGAKTPGLLAWSATCIGRRDGKALEGPVPDRVEAKGDKAFVRTVDGDGMRCVLVVEAQGSDALPSASDRERFFRSLARTGEPIW